MPVDELREQCVSCIHLSAASSSSSHNLDTCRSLIMLMHPSKHNSRPVHIVLLAKHIVSSQVLQVLAKVCMRAQAFES